MLKNYSLWNVEGCLMQMHYSTSFKKARHFFKDNYNGSYTISYWFKGESINRKVRL